MNTVVNTTETEFEKMILEEKEEQMVEETFDEHEEENEENENEDEETDKHFYSPESGKARLACLPKNIFYWIDAQPSVNVYTAVVRGVISHRNRLRDEGAQAFKAGTELSELLVMKTRWIGMLVPKLKMSEKTIFTSPAVFENKVPEEVEKYFSESDPIQILQMVIDLVQSRILNTQDSLNETQTTRVSNTEYKELNDRLHRLKKTGFLLINLIKECQGRFKNTNKKFVPQQQQRSRSKERTVQPREQRNRSKERAVQPREQRNRSRERPAYREQRADDEQDYREKPVYREHRPFPRKQRADDDEQFSRESRVRRDFHEQRPAYRDQKADDQQEYKPRTRGNYKQMAAPVISKESPPRNKF